MEVRDKVVAVTGGGNGIGRQVVLELLRRGAKVAAVDIRQESLDETIELAAAGDRLATFAVDITNRSATESLPAEIADAHGPVDAVINVAGIIQPFVPLKDLEFEAIDRVINVNLYGTINIVKAFLPTLLQRPEAHLANVSSMGGFLPVPGQTIYGATKAAVKLMTEGLYAELLETNVGGRSSCPVRSVPKSPPTRVSRYRERTRNKPRTIRRPRQKTPPRSFSTASRRDVSTSSSVATRS